jgi:hypothetical protein
MAPNIESMAPIFCTAANCIVYQPPYVISLLSNQTVQVHNLETQSLVQTLAVDTKHPAKFMVQASYPVDIQYTSPNRVTFEKDEYENGLEFETPINHSENKIIDLTQPDTHTEQEGINESKNGPEFETPIYRSEDKAIDLTQPDTQIQKEGTITYSVTQPELQKEQRAEPDENSPMRTLLYHSQSNKDARSPILTGQKTGSIQVIIGTSTEIIGLLMVPLHIQLLELFQLNEIEEALVLLSQIQPSDPSLDPTTRQKFHTRGGFHFLTKLDYDSSLLNFQKGSLQPQYLIALFFHSPTILSDPNDVDDAILEYIQENNSITQIISKKYPKQPNQMTKQLHNARQFLVSYLLDFDPTELIDTTLLKLYTLLNQQQNLLQLVTLPNLCDLNQAEGILTDHQYVLSMLYKQRGEYTKTLDIWIKILKGEIISSEFTLEQIIELLTQLSDKDDVLKYARMVLNRDCVRGVQIFINRTDNVFTQTEVLEFIELWKTSKRVYLETIKNDDYSIDLLELYLNDIDDLDDGYMVKELGIFD